MRSHLPFTEEERSWRREHLQLDVARRHYASDEHTSLDAATRAIAAPVHGFDVSSYQQSAPDFAANGRQFAIWKATEGTSYFDAHFAANRAKAHSLDLLMRAMYHFARPGSHTPAQEVAWLLSKVGARQDREVIALDYEVPPWLVTWIIEFLNRLHDKGWPTLFYSYLGMLSANATAGIPQTGAGLWVAAYGCREPASDRWAYKTLWQHTDGAASVCGNDGPWDCSVGEASVVAALAGAQSPPSSTWTFQEEPMSYPAPIPADGKTVTIPVPPPHAGGCQGGYGAVWLSLSYDDPGVGTTDDTIPARVVGVTLDNPASVVAIAPGDAENVRIPRSRVAWAVPNNVGSIKVTNKAPKRADGSPGPTIYPMIEAETRGVPAK